MATKEYSAFTEVLIEKIKKEKTKPSLLLHACCAPCSSYVLEYLSRYFDISLYYFNPNISPKKEYIFRLKELSRFLKEIPEAKGLKIIDAPYDEQIFFDAVKGLETLPEGDKRCYKCYYLRLEDTARKARELSFDYFTTTLSISPYKNADWLNEIGQVLEVEYGVKYLVSDFKKKNGYKRSIELSREYGLYRQDYCGCIFSKKQAESRLLEKELK